MVAPNGSLLFDVGHRIKYRYFARRPKGGYQLRFCYATEPNTNGAYITWEEVITPTVFHREKFDEWKTAADARNVQRSRFKRRKVKNDEPAEEVAELESGSVGETKKRG